jgi:hypothetical protein
MRLRAIRAPVGKAVVLPRYAFQQQPVWSPPAQEVPSTRAWRIGK